MKSVSIVWIVNMGWRDHWIQYLCTYLLYHVSTYCSTCSHRPCVDDTYQLKLLPPQQQNLNFGWYLSLELLNRILFYKDVLVPTMVNTAFSVSLNTVQWEHFVSTSVSLHQCWFRMTSLAMEEEPSARLELLLLGLLWSYLMTDFPEGVSHQPFFYDVHWYIAYVHAEYFLDDRQHLLSFYLEVENFQELR